LKPHFIVAGDQAPLALHPFCFVGIQTGVPWAGDFLGRLPPQNYCAPEGPRTKTLRSNVMSKQLDGQVAVVTGASKGIGAAIAEHLAAAGAAVVVNYASSKAGAEAVVKRVRQTDGKAVAVQADVSRLDDVRRLFAETKKAFGKLDILVNNAGIYEFSPLESISAEHFHKQFDLNVLGLLLTTQEAVKHFGPSGGSIVNIGSVVATVAPPNTSVYSGTKAAVNAITKSLAQELGPRKIRVNAVNPGMIETEGVHAAGIADSDFRRATEAQTPLGRIGQPQDIAPAVVFLASPESGWTTGETLYISGGLR
jgi:3-oxoacyl-[acyl-carrier protein] reductase